VRSTSRAQRGSQKWRRRRAWGEGFFGASEKEKCFGALACFVEEEEKDDKQLVSRCCGYVFRKFRQTSARAAASLSPSLSVFPFLHSSGMMKNNQCYNLFSEILTLRKSGDRKTTGGQKFVFFSFFLLFWRGHSLQLLLLLLLLLIKKRGTG